MNSMKTWINLHDGLECLLIFEFHLDDGSDVEHMRIEAFPFWNNALYALLLLANDFSISLMKIKYQDGSFHESESRLFSH
jgi:hypothetical protein